MWKFRKEYRGQSVALASGELVNASNLSDKKAKAIFKQAPGLSYLLEEVEDPASEAPKAKAEPAEKPAPVRKRTRKTAK